jgi:hypothetical protein
MSLTHKPIYVARSTENNVSLQLSGAIIMVSDIQLSELPSSQDSIPQTGFSTSTPENAPGSGSGVTRVNSISGPTNITNSVSSLSGSIDAVFNSNGTQSTPDSLWSQWQTVLAPKRLKSLQFWLTMLIAIGSLVIAYVSLKPAWDSAAAAHWSNALAYRQSCQQAKVSDAAFGVLFLNTSKH